MSSVSYRTFTGTGAKNYQRHFVPAIATPVSKDLLEAASLQSGERIVDVACGTGLIARLAAEQVGPTGSVTAIDISPDMIDVARATPSPTAPSIEWQVGDAISLPLPDASHDIVLCQRWGRSWRRPPRRPRRRWNDRWSRRGRPTWWRAPLPSTSPW